MKSKFKDGHVTLVLKENPVQIVEIHKDKTLLFGTDNPETLLSVSKVIADFAKALRDEEKK